MRLPLYVDARWWQFPWNAFALLAAFIQGKFTRTKDWYEGDRFLYSKYNDD